jgi:hypothetical protein
MITAGAHSLDEQIAAAFKDGMTSRAVAVLISEVEAAAAQSDEAAEIARTRALDPACPLESVNAQRRAMEDAAFRRDRLSVALPRLGDRQRELAAAEENQRRRTAYDEVMAERDRLADELRRVYPPLAAQLADLLARVEANDRQVVFINANALPSGANRLLLAELVARGLQGFVTNSRETPGIVEQVRLPAFALNEFEPYAWPRS